MTEEGKSSKTNIGDFPSSLENANCAFPTFPPPRLLLSSTPKQHQKPKAERSLPRPSLRSPSGSSFDWKRLLTPDVSFPSSANLKARRRGGQSESLLCDTSP